MKKILFASALALSACGNTTEKTQEHQHAQQAAPAEAPKAKSPQSNAMVMVGDNHIHIDYSAPSMRGRQIFGGLVAYGEVWVTGAHRATSIAFDQAVRIGETTVPAGKYGFFTIPGENSWTIILNKQWDMHLADDYSAEADVLRMEVKPQVLSEPVETLTYTVESIDASTGLISFSWADVKISFETKNQ